MGQLVRDGVTNAVALDYEGVGDVLVGGAGVDTFRVGADEGVDLILDFELGVDRIRLEGGLEVASGASARASIASVGAAVAITVYILERTDGSGSTTVVLPGLSGGTVDDIFFSV
jgi:Ca2+-binding RTX toxin-like protein